MNENRSDPVIDWLAAKEEKFTKRRLWYERGASLAAFLFLLYSFMVTALWLTGLANSLAQVVAVVSFVLAFLMAGIDGAMEKDK